MSGSPICWMFKWWTRIMVHPQNGYITALLSDIFSSLQYYQMVDPLNERSVYLLLGRSAELPNWWLADCPIRGIEHRSPGEPITNRRMTDQGFLDHQMVILRFRVYVHPPNCWMTDPPNDRCSLCRITKFLIPLIHHSSSNPTKSPIITRVG